MPIAKEVLRIGFTVAALPGGYITKEAVDQYGWHDKVTDGPDIGGELPAQPLKDALAPKGPPQRGA